MTIIVGITGLIASGKTTLCSYLKKLNYKIFEADNSARELYNDEDFLLIIKKDFPEVFIDGKIDKKLLAKIIFNDVNKKKQLENIIHPIVNGHCDNFISKNRNEKILFIESALLFEADWYKKCNKIILLTIDRGIEKQRYTEREGSDKLFDIILKNQVDVKNKIEKCDYIIENNSDIFHLYKETDKVLYKLNNSTKI